MMLQAQLVIVSHRLAFYVCYRKMDVKVFVHAGVHLLCLALPQQMLYLYIRHWFRNYSNTSSQNCHTVCQRMS